MNLALVRTEIDKRYVSHTEFARYLGVHPITLSRFLTGKSVLRPYFLLRLIDALNIKPEELMSAS